MTGDLYRLDWSETRSEAEKSGGRLIELRKWEELVGERSVI